MTLLQCEEGLEEGEENGARESSWRNEVSRSQGQQGEALGKGLWGLKSKDDVQVKLKLGAKKRMKSTWFQKPPSS